MISLANAAIDKPHAITTSISADKNMHNIPSLLCL